MALQPGTRVGSFEVVALLGSGGMGEVYRARDARLGREVALKVLSPDLASDGRALQRLEREARAVAALSHPNIVSVFDFLAERDRACVVMELLEGRTLRSLLSDGPLPLGRILELGIQLCRGLAAAHDRGVVHRDLKPENVFVTRDGVVKILDFGLARVDAAGPSESADATAEKLTSDGALVGTFAYMSPEQARGLPADSRSDLFSLGLVLREMLTGRAEFVRPSVAETLGALLRDEPGPLSESRTGVPPLLEAALARCLEKDPSRRFRSAADLEFVLGRVAHAVALPALAGSRPAHSASTYALAASSLVALLLAGLGGWGVARRGAAREPTFIRLTFGLGTIAGARFVPGSQAVVYSARPNGGALRLFEARPGAPEPRPLGPLSADVVAVYPEGDLLVLLGADADAPNRMATLARATATGDAPREIQSAVHHADLLPDGRLALIRDVGLSNDQVELSPGSALDSSHSQTRGLRSSPDGRSLAWTESPSGLPDSWSLVLFDTASRKRTVLGRGWNQVSLAFGPNGRDVWFTARRGTERTALRTLSPGGRERRLLEVPADLRLLDVARDGRILVASELERTSLVAGDASGSGERDLTWLSSSVVADLSPDGSRILVTEQGEAGGSAGATYLRASDGSPAVRLGEGDADALSPDGRWALVRSRGLPAEQILLPTGTGEARTLPRHGLEYAAGALWTTPEAYFFSARAGGRPPRVYRREVASGEIRPVTPEGTQLAGVSLDGRTVVITRDGGELGGLVPVDGGEPRPLPRLPRGAWFAGFLPGGRSFLAAAPRRDAGGFAYEVTAVDLEDGRSREWREIRPADPVGLVGLDLLVALDGRHYAYTVRRRLSDIYVVRGLD